jgi:hypothetical protein
MQRIDFEIVPLIDSLGKRFAYDLTRQEFKALSTRKKDWTHILYTPIPTKTDKRRAPYIRKGAMIDEDVIQIFREQKIRFVPILEDVPGSAVKTRLSDFAKTQSAMLLGRAFGCVQEWLRDSATNLSTNVQEVMQTRMRELSRILGSTFRDTQLMVQHVCNELVNMQDYLTAYALYENLLSELRPAGIENDEEADSIEHAMQVMVASVIIGMKSGMKDSRLRQLAQAAVLHDIGLVVAYEQCREEMLSRRIPPWKFGEYALITQRRHPTLGALLVTRRDGHTISGIDPVVRAIILEHECAINGTGPGLYMPEHEGDLHKLGIHQETRVHGHNQLPGNIDEEHLFSMTGIEGQPHQFVRRMTMGAQIVAIVEKYFTLLAQHKAPEVLRSMIIDAGTRLNRALFDQMVNFMIPFHHMPQGAIFRLRAKVGSPIEPYNRSYVMVNGKSGIDFLIMRDQYGEKIKPVPVSYDDVRKNGRLSVDAKV